MTQAISKLARKKISHIFKRATTRITLLRRAELQSKREEEKRSNEQDINSLRNKLDQL
jgi:hypothetical protein